MTRELTDLALRWVMRVGGAASARGVSPWHETRFEWRSSREPEAVVADLRGGITPRPGRVGNAVRAAFLTGLDRMSVTGQAGESAFSLRANAGLRTPWRQRIDGRVSVAEGGSMLTASLRPSRWGALYFAGTSAVALIVAAILMLGAALSLPFVPSLAGQLLEACLVALFFGGVFVGIGRWSCRLGLTEAERLVALVDEAAGTVGVHKDAP